MIKKILDLSLNSSVEEKTTPSEKKLYSSLKKSSTSKLLNNRIPKETNKSNELLCEFCNKSVKKENIIKGNGGKTLICRNCFNKLF